MKRILEWTTHVIALIVAIIGLIYLLSILIEIFPVIWLTINSQFFVSILTLLVGIIAYALYLKQKSDQKRDMASLILQEIRYAEQKVREARSRQHDYRLAHKLLPTNNWNRNIHLFVSDLEENQLDTISRFYSELEFIDYLIKNIAENVVLSKQENPVSVPIGPVVPSAPPVSAGNNPIAGIQLLIVPPQAQQLLSLTSEQVEFIYNSSAADILRKIAKK